jgi:negative regulator of sigma E activity
MSPASLGSVAVPSPVKYAATTTSGPTVAGRLTQLVELTVAGAVEERWFQDVTTGLLLRRDQLSSKGTVVRSVGFDRITIGQAKAAPAPEHSVDLRPKQASSTNPKKPYVAPASLPGGYQRVAMFRRSSTLHVVYSDGLHGLSMFEQPGRLDKGSIPAGGQAVTIGNHGGFQYVYAGGQVVVWQAAGATYTVVGDGAPEDVVAAARGVPVRKAQGPFDRVRRACGKVMQAVSGTG